MQLCDYEGTSLSQTILVKVKLKYTDGNDDEENFQLIAAMPAYINASSISMNDGMDCVAKCLNATICIFFR